MKQKVFEMVSAAIEVMGAPAPDKMEIEVPRDASHGDLATPVAMTLARVLKKSPRAIAEGIIAALPERDIFERVEIAGPGFINFTFSAAYLQSRLGELLAKGPGMLRVNVGNGVPVQIEFVSANPTGPLHLGHGRGAAVGDALANLLEAAGYRVEREYYINDAGRQVELLGQSVFARYMQVLGREDFPFPEDGYRGDYITDAARDIAGSRGREFYDSSFEEAGRFFIDESLKKMLALIKTDLEAFSVRFDTWQSERALHDSGAVAHAIEFLKGKGLIYEHEGAIWFRATDLGDDKDRVVIKNDGGHTYFASDIAYHLNKVERGFDEVINIWGADHHGYVPRLEAVMDALGPGRKKLSVLLVQMVSLMRGGQPVQMSKRSGDFVTLSELMEEVGADTTKFIFLTRRHDSHLTFDLEVAKAQSAENPVFYVQYANARINSIFNKALEEGMDLSGLDKVSLAPLTEPEELDIIKKLLNYMVAFELAAQNREPHRITYYLQELAGMFHPFYNKHRVLVEDRELALARLALLRAIRLVVIDGLTLLGISAPEKM